MVFHASRERFLCSDSLESPLLLVRSGIGDPQILASAGVDPVATSPQVGEQRVDFVCAFVGVDRLSICEDFGPFHTRY